MSLLMSVLDIALKLALHGLAVFPCQANKVPACPGGFKAATKDPDKIRDLWHRYPGPLIGVATGEVSGIDVLDIDYPRHPEAADWWCAVKGKLPSTRVYQTRSGGVHAVFLHRPGLRCWAGRPMLGIDGRGDGGYVVWWPAAGMPICSGADPIDWPDWLLEELKPAQPMTRAAWSPTFMIGGGNSNRYAAAALRDAAGKVAKAPAGCRNDTLNAQAFAMTRFIREGLLEAQHVADALATAALASGLGAG